MDISSIDIKIQEYLRSEEKKLELYNSKITDIDALIFDPDIADCVKRRLETTREDYAKRIGDLCSGKEYNFYVAESSPIIERYKTILKTPVKVSFFRPKDSDTPKEDEKTAREKEKLVSEYLQIAKKYISNVAVTMADMGSKKTKCDTCGSKSQILVDGVVNICTDCGAEREESMAIMSFKDMSRSKVVSKSNSYEKKSHFFATIRQFQGKPPKDRITKADEELLETLEREFEKRHLLRGDKTADKPIRFSLVKKEHFLLVLQELGLNKQYENVNFLHSEMTGTKCHDISHLVDQLLEDFDAIDSLYTEKYKHEKNISRKSFINSQILLFQLLRKNKYPCKEDDFNMLKTADRKNFHDNILQDLFVELGWNYTPFF